MSRSALEVAYGPAWRQAHAGRVSVEQLKVMSAIERCRTAELGGHVARCEDCAYTTIAYNSCLMGKFLNGELTNDCISTRNQRLAAVHSLARFVAVDCPEYIGWSGEIRSIPFKKPSQRLVAKGLNRIRHYGQFAKGSCADNIAHARQLLAAAKP